MDSAMARTSALLATHRDLVADRTFDSAALDVRAWRAFLLALDDGTLDRIEGGGAWPDDAPPSLRAFVDDVREACSLPSLDQPPNVGRALAARSWGGATATNGARENGGQAPDLRSEEGAHAARRHESPRKQAQVDAFARILASLVLQSAQPRRVVDVGSGHGHLTREIAARLGVPVVGLERDAALVARARSLAGDDAMFAQADVVRDGFAFSRDDVIIGLHACGELGDALVTSAARVGASVALIGCCLQKRRALVRAPLSDEGVAIERDVLGLSNLTARDDGVEASRADNLAARERRLALRRLLEGAGVDVPRFGAEIAGLNRRAAHDELPLFVQRAFAARALPAPAPHEIDEAARWARVHHAQQRRLQLPRTLLARVLEVHVALDRARHLAAHGNVRVGTAFDDAVSARNIIIASSCQHR